MHHHSQQQAQRIDHDMVLAARHFLARIIAPRPPFSVVLTDWLSMIAALGVGATWIPACAGVTNETKGMTGETTDMPSGRLLRSTDHQPLTTSHWSEGAGA